MRKPSVFICVRNCNWSRVSAQLPKGIPWALFARWMKAHECLQWTGITSAALEVGSPSFATPAD